jgi:peptidoglycan hydrolase CwlO-like protein
LENISERYNSIANERRQLAESQVDLTKQVKQLSSELAGQSSVVEQLRGELDAKSKAYEKAVSESRQFATDLKQQQAAIHSMQSDLKAAQKMQPQNEKLQNDVAQLRAALKELSAEHDQSLAANAKAQTTIRDLQNEMHESTKTIRELRRPRGSIFQFGEDNDEDQHRRAA